MIIIYAHPNKEGHCGYILERAKHELDKKKKEYEILDLYEMKFDPVLKPDEHYTSGRKKVTAENKKIQEKIKNTDGIVIIYPTWWNGTPAILKGFFDRIFTSGYAFSYENGIPRGYLKKKAVVITTTGGPKIIEKTFLGNRSLKVVLQDTLKFCGIKARGHMIGSATRFTDKQKRKIEKTVKKTLGYLG